jgi:hypothetical protein
MRLLRALVFLFALALVLGCSKKPDNTATPPATVPPPPGGPPTAGGVPGGDQPQPGKTSKTGKENAPKDSTSTPVVQP